MSLIDQDLPCFIKNVSLLSKKTIISHEARSSVLMRIVEDIRANKDQIIRISEEDYYCAKQHNCSSSILNRLKLDEIKITGCIQGLKQLMELDDPIDQISFIRELDNGLTLTKRSYPIGLIGVVLEARPDAFLQIIGIGIKTNNFMIIKPGMEVNKTCKFLMDIIHQILLEKQLPIQMLTLMNTREQVAQLLKEERYVDLIIPRGSNKLVKYIQENTNIPVMGHTEGICHIYIEQADHIQKTLELITDSKVQYSAACNSVETLLINQSIAYEFLPLLVRTLEHLDVDIYAEKGISEILNKTFRIPVSWSVEYGNRSISLKIVENLEEAIDHINYYGSHHTDSIITQNSRNAKLFMQRVDSANVYHNCSTRFADGYRYGFGAEIGISTNKVLPRGPVAIEGLTTYKYHLVGKLHIIDDYVKGKKKFNHTC